MKFTKMHGLGNDFILFDFLDKDFPDNNNWGKIALRLCSRGFGVGADGIVLVYRDANWSYKMTIYNSDGSKAEMCGNAIRCVGKYLYEAKGIKKDKISIVTGAGIKELELIKKGDKVQEIKVDMGAPILHSEDIPIKGNNRKIIKENLKTPQGEVEITAVSMGNPHVIIFNSQLKDEKINQIGPYLEKHEMFPNGTNVEFVKVLSREEITVKVWERGAGRTYACGTGACAALVASVLNGLTDNKARVNLPGGPLNIEWEQKEDKVYMSGGAEFVYTGNLKPEFCIV